MADPGFYRRRCRQIAARQEFSIESPDDAQRTIRDLESIRSDLADLKSSLDDDLEQLHRHVRKKQRKYRPRIDRPEDRLMHNMRSVAFHSATTFREWAYSYEARRIDGAIQQCDEGIVRCQAYLYRRMSESG